MMRPNAVEPIEFQEKLVKENPDIFLQYAGSLVEESMEVFSRVHNGEAVEFEDLDNTRARLMTAQRILTHLGKKDELNAAINMIGNIALQEARLGVFSMTYFHHLALDSFYFIKQSINSEDLAYGMNLMNQGTALMLLGSLKAERLDDYFREAIDCFIKARSFFPPQSLEFLSSLQQQGNSLIRLYELNPQEPLLLRQSEQVIQEALGLVNKDSLEQAELLVILATIPIYEFVLQGNLDIDFIRRGLQRSEYYCVEADKVYEQIAPQGLRRGMCLMYLGMAQQLLAKTGTDMQTNYQLALTNLYTARGHLEFESIEFCRCLTTESTTRTEIAIHEKFSLLSNLLVAINLARDAQGILYEVDRHSIDYALSLYAEGYARYILGSNNHGARENLQRALELCERVKEMVGPGTFLFTRSVLIESSARLKLAEITNRHEDLQQVHYMLEQAQKMILPGTFDYAECLLAKAQLLRIAKRPLSEFLKAIELAREGYKIAANDLLALTIDAQSAVAELQAGEFAAAHRRCIKALEKQSEMLEVSFSIRDKKFLLEQNSIIRNTLVETCLEEKKIEEAVCHLERGRNLLLGEYFKKIVGDIEEPDIRFMKNLSKRINRTIINISVGESKTVLFIFRPDQTLTFEILPISRQSIFEQIFDRDIAGTASGWFSSYFDYLDDKEQNREYLPNWKNQISRTLEWLIEFFVKPVYKSLDKDEIRLAFIASNQLSMLPLHAAVWLYLSENKPEAELPDIVFAPSMWVLGQSDSRTDNYADQDSAAVFRWQGTDLQWADLEISQIQKSLLNAPQPTAIFSGEEQSFDECLNLAETHSIWHFACHGLWQWEDILSSTLLLTEDNTLSLGDLFENYAHRFAYIRQERLGAFGYINEEMESLYNPQLVVFSACEIGIGTEAFAETETCFSFPTAFLLAGTKCVIAALWAVDDFTTSILMGRFYKNLSKRQSYSIALRNAQMWMKELSLEELSELLGEYEHLPNYSKIVRRFGRWQRKKVTHPFADPYHWAAFQITGNSVGEV